MNKVFNILFIILPKYSYLYNINKSNIRYLDILYL